MPLNLTVLNALAKFIYVYILSGDPHFINEEKSIESGEIKGCNVKNMELIQDFSMINNLFCDKTGTLTKNILIFKSLVFDGNLLEIKKDFEEYKSLVNSF